MDDDSLRFFERHWEQAAMFEYCGQDEGRNHVQAMIVFDITRVPICNKNVSILVKKKRKIII